MVRAWRDCHACRYASRGNLDPRHSDRTETTTASRHSLSADGSAAPSKDVPCDCEAAGALLHGHIEQKKHAWAHEPARRARFLLGRAHLLLLVDDPPAAGADHRLLPSA